MLKRIKDRVNERGVFEISRIEPCGSMAEKTAAWKYSRQTGERHTEFDFLAVLAHSPDIVRRDHDCRQCVGVSELPLQKNTLYEKDYSGLFKDDNDRRRCNNIFLRELNTCLDSACDCFSVLPADEADNHSYSYKLAEKSETNYRCGCDKCVIEVDTGILRINDSVSVGPNGEAKCSLAFRWTSKAKKLSACDALLQGEPEQMTSLTIHVDFLPALQVLKNKSDEAACEHDFFLVPKRCNSRDNVEHWRKSNCRAEIAYIVNEMSEKHRKCYTIVKYLLSRQIEYTIGDINTYILKTTALKHSRGCSDSSKACAECVLHMLTELKHAYKKPTIFIGSGVKFFNRMGKNITPSYSKFSVEQIIQELIQRLCSVAQTDSCSILLQPVNERTPVFFKMHPPIEPFEDF